METMMRMFSRLRHQESVSGGPESPAETSGSPYSAEIVHLLASRFNLRPGSLGADIGAGKGRLAELFLEHGYPLIVTEAGAAERAVCQGLQQRFNTVRTVSGTPEATSLPAHSVDFILSERALFAPSQAAVQQEFQRILRPGGVVLLITDNRVYGGGEQPEEYEALLERHCSGFAPRREPYDIAGAVQRFFSSGQVYEDAFIGARTFTRSAFIAQASALPIYPAAGDPARKSLDHALRKFFAKWAVNNALIVPVVCRVACGRLEGQPSESDPSLPGQVHPLHA